MVISNGMAEPAVASTTPEPADGELLRRVRAGDAAALEELCRRHLDAAYRVALRYAGRAQDAEDAVQSAFLRLLSKDCLQRAQGYASARGWILAIVVDACRKQARTEASRRRREHAVPAQAPHLDRTEQQELGALVRAKLQELPDDYRLPVWMHYLEHLTFREIGEVLGLSEDAAEKRVSRGLDKLRGALSAAGFASVALPALFAGLHLESAPASLEAGLKALAARNFLAGAAAKGAAPAKGAGAWIAVAALGLCGALGVYALSGTRPAPAAPPPPAGTPSAVQASPSSKAWEGVAENLGGADWKFPGVTILAAVPGRAELLAGVSEQGLWSSTDGGATWKKLGANDPVPIRNRPYRILFDPGDPKVFWVGGNYGRGVFKTTDGGATFSPLGALQHVDGVAVDFSDPRRSTLLAALHAQGRCLVRSTDGGETWRALEDAPEVAALAGSDPVFLGRGTFLVNRFGHGEPSRPGLYRTEDAGETWTRVAERAPLGPPLFASDGTIYWQGVFGSGLMRSSDLGRTWTAMPSVVATNLVELPGGRLAGCFGPQVFVSDDRAQTWKPHGPPLPFKPREIVYVHAWKSLFAWRFTERKEARAVVRLALE